MHLYVLNRGLGRHSAVLFVPLNVAAGLLANVTAGFLLYGEAPVFPVQFALGITVLLSGVLCLAVAREATTMAGDATASPPAKLQRTVSAAERGDIGAAARLQAWFDVASPDFAVEGLCEGIRRFSMHWVSRKMRARRSPWATQKPKNV